MTRTAAETAKAQAPGALAAKLPAEGTQARRFGKTRSAQSTALLEDYVELIADLLGSAGEARPTDIARRLGVSHATAVKTISRLKRAGLATARPYRGAFLTEKGQALADRVRVRHRLVVDVLCALGVPTEFGGGGRRGHRASRLGNYVESVRAIPQARAGAEQVARLIRSRQSSIGSDGVRPRVGQRVDDSVDDFLDQSLVVAFSHDADYRLGSGWPHDQPAVPVEALFARPRSPSAPRNSPAVCRCDSARS